MTLDETFSAIARAFPHANRRKISSFSAEPPAHLVESASTTIRAVCARIARGRALQALTHDQSRIVREAAISRLHEIGEILPDAMPEPIDLSDEYYASIAQRLVNDFPDRNGDWVRDAVAATVRSYRMTSGVQLDAERLLDAVDERLAELNSECSSLPLDEAIETLGDVDDVHMVERPAPISASVVHGVLPLDIRRRILDESGSIVIDAPKRITFRTSIGPRERSAIAKVITAATAGMHNIVANWTQVGQRTATIQYGLR